MTIHDTALKGAPFPDYFFHSLPLDDRLWVVVGVIGIGGKNAAGELTVDLLIAHSDWRRRSLRTITNKSSGGWTGVDHGADARNASL